jgi:hypothetical protein
MNKLGPPSTVGRIGNYSAWLTKYCTTLAISIGWSLPDFILFSIFHTVFKPKYRPYTTTLILHLIHQKIQSLFYRGIESKITLPTFHAASAATMRLAA